MPTIQIEPHSNLANPKVAKFYQVCSGLAVELEYLLPPISMKFDDWGKNPSANIRAIFKWRGIDLITLYRQKDKNDDLVSCYFLIPTVNIILAKR